MPEINSMQINVVNQKCPKCGVGNMQFNGVIQMTEPKLYGHRCDSCGETRDYGMKYPYVV
jgi:uncharacterized protein (DUF983 family)